MLPLTCMVLYAHAQLLQQPQAFPHLSLSAYSAYHQNAFSFTGNQAALATMQQACVGVYGERRFMLADVGAYSLAAAFPTSLGNFGLQANHAGFKNFNESKIGLAYARNLGSRAAAGVQFNYYNYRIPSYTGVSAVIAEAGVVFHLSNNLHAGIHCYNPASFSFIKGSNEKLTAAYSFGMGYDASENFFAAAGIIKETNMPVNVQAGFGYEFAKQFFAAAGFNSATSSVYAGAGLCWKNLRLDITGSYHPLLGLSPGVMLLTNFKTDRTGKTAPAVMQY